MQQHKALADSDLGVISPRDLSAAKETTLRWLLDTEAPAFGTVSRISTLRPSRDGSRIGAVGISLPNLENSAVRSLILVNTETGKLREWALEPSAIAWSQSTLVVVSGSQLHILRDGADDLQHVHDLDGPVDKLSVSPSGSTVLFVSPLEQPDSWDAAPAVMVSIEERAPQVYLGRAERTRQLTVGAITPRGSLENIHTIPLPGWNLWEASWIDDRTIVGIVSPQSGESGWYAPVLARILLTGSGGATVDVCYRPQNQAQLSCPVSIGGSLAVIEGIASDRGVVAGDVVIVTPSTTQTMGTADIDVTHLDAAWGTLSWAGVRGLRTVVGLAHPHRSTPSEFAVEEMLDTEETFAGGLPTIFADEEGRLYGILESFQRYPRLVSITPGGVSTLYDLSHPGSDFLRAAGGRVESVRWDAPDGLTIEGFVVLPDSEGPHPLVVNVHGGPVSMWRNRWSIQNNDRHPYAALLASLGIASFYPNPRGSLGRGQQFADLVRGDMFGDDVHDILSGIDSLVARGIADPLRLGVTGNSYGGSMTAWLTGTTSRFAVAVSTSPAVDFTSQHHLSNIPAFDELFLRGDLRTDPDQYLSRSPITHAHRSTTPTLITAGLRDKVTPPSQAIELFQQLHRAGVPTELALYPHQGHGVAGFPDSVDFLSRIVAWFSTFLDRR